MSNSSFHVTRLPQRLDPDPARVICRFFRPGDEARIRAILGRIMALDDTAVQWILTQIKTNFGPKHPNIDDVLIEHFEKVREFLPPESAVDAQRRLLIGAYFTMEYAIESAALFNPSMVPSFDQEGLPEGTTRFMMSLRATGEGHVSSIVFRTGEIDRDHHIRFDPPSPYSRPLQVVPNRAFDKETFWNKLIEVGAYSELADQVMSRCGATFTMRELNEAIEQVRQTLADPASICGVADDMLSLARLNYQLRLPDDAMAAEVVIFPHSDNESRGIEDVRMVRFVDDDGTDRYFGTYTAYNGSRIFPQIFETTRFETIQIHTLSGKYAQNKGMALFPRRIDGYYVMVSRLDNENIFLMRSNNVRFWNNATVIQTPTYPWEIVQLGNCGSPIETPAGWLLLTHGVGPMRRYSIGATLLDLNDPTRLIGQTREPLLVPIGDERVGYVPNVVYSCGGMIHNETLVIPYAMSDISTSFATVPLANLLDLLTSQS